MTLAISDPNVDVVYVSPVHINPEMSQYYGKLFGLKDAIDSGEVNDQADVSMRYKIITPDAVKCFPVSITLHSAKQSINAWSD